LRGAAARGNGRGQKKGEKRRWLTVRRKRNSGEPELLGVARIDGKLPVGIGEESVQGDVDAASRPRSGGAGDVEDRDGAAGHQVAVRGGRRPRQWRQRDDGGGGFAWEEDSERGRGERRGIGYAGEREQLGLLLSIEGGRGCSTASASGARARAVLTARCEERDDRGAGPGCTVVIRPRCTVGAHPFPFSFLQFNLATV
jgi:hypothetical protein